MRIELKRKRTEINMTQVKTEAWPIAQRKKLAMNEHLFCVGVQGDLGVGNT